MIRGTLFNLWSASLLLKSNIQLFGGLNLDSFDQALSRFLASPESWLDLSKDNLWYI